MVSIQFLVTYYQLPTSFIGYIATLIRLISETAGSLQGGRQWVEWFAGKQWPGLRQGRPGGGPGALRLEWSSGRQCHQLQETGVGARYPHSREICVLHAEKIADFNLKTTPISMKTFIFRVPKGPPPLFQKSLTIHN